MEEHQRAIPISREHISKEDNEMLVVQEFLDRLVDNALALAPIALEPTEPDEATVEEILQDLTDKAVTCHVNHEASKEEEVIAETTPGGDLVEDAPASIPHITYEDDATTHAPVDQGDESTLPVEENILQDQDQDKDRGLTDEARSFHHADHTDHTTGNEEASTAEAEAEKEETSAVAVDILRDLVDVTVSSTYQERQQTVASGRDPALAELLARASAEEQRRAPAIIVISDDEGGNDSSNDECFTTTLARHGKKKKTIEGKRADGGRNGGGGTRTTQASSSSSSSSRSPILISIEGDDDTDAAATAIDVDHHRGKDRLASGSSQGHAVSISSSPLNMSSHRAPSSSNGSEVTTSTASTDASNGHSIKNNIVDKIRQRRAEIIFHKHAYPERQKGRYDRPSPSSSSGDDDEDDGDSPSVQSPSDDESEEEAEDFEKSPSPVFRYRPRGNGGVGRSGRGIRHGNGKSRVSGVGVGIGVGGGSGRQQQGEVIDLTLDSSSDNDEAPTAPPGRQQSRVVAGSKRKKTTGQKQNIRAEANQPSRKKLKTRGTAAAVPSRPAAAAASASRGRGLGSMGRIAARLAAAAERKKRGQHWRY